MLHEIQDYLLLILAGFIGGLLNTIASSGSAVTLPMMIFIGMPPTTANATNRLSLFLTFITATYKFHKAGLINWKKHLKLVPILVIGVLLGTFYVDSLSDNSVKKILAFALCISILMIFLRSKALQEGTNSNLKNKISVGIIISTFMIGIWGGLIVLGVGIFMFLAFTTQQGMSLAEANIQKAVFMLFISGISLLIFSIHQEIDYIAGLFLSMGSVCGAFIGTRFTTNPALKIWIFRILVLTIFFEVLKLIFDVYFYEFKTSHSIIPQSFSSFQAT